MHKVSIRPLALADIDNIVDFYNDLNNTLSEDLISELDICIHTISKNPQAFQKRIEDARIIYLKRFPYGIFYKIYPKEVRIIAVIHTSRNPNIWKKR
ncbi:hypothetical protein ULMS_02340 [Patiriisocius marinistellae]|uniref:Type II toxin-antitoxin system RelE/ParE family toxin n=1 Tax=Patiriisocius marinistellae TaxID=2494560 RepID=A0A5J4FX73_9FLAO|nr:type II toxin-antitoxin system RelE/ParE family toxin [Patiriisocius marinistellae]GEQ84726.1 hypothetical protein ULMS_02340 [Patiriisocius marinistellae]